MLDRGSLDCSTGALDNARIDPARPRRDRGLRADRDASRIMVGIKSLTERTRAEALEERGPGM